MSFCEESHGIFQFTDDCFRQDFVQRVREEKHKAQFHPVYCDHGWFVDKNPLPGYEKLQLQAFHVDLLYMERRYSECLLKAKQALAESNRKHNQTERMLLETIIRCSIKLNDTEGGLNALAELNLHHSVEEPGLSSLKAQAYFHFKDFVKGLQYGEEYLRLRPGDISMHLLIGSALSNINPDLSKEHLAHGKRLTDSRQEAQTGV